MRKARREGFWWALDFAQVLASLAVAYRLAGYILFFPHGKCCRVAAGLGPKSPGARAEFPVAQKIF